jgi:hypothetical protein
MAFMDATIFARAPECYAEASCRLAPRTSLGAVRLEPAMDGTASGG